MDAYSNKKKPVVALVGPTASGKTALSIALAKATGGEIVILQNPDGSLLYAVSLGGARIAYADAATGFVVSGDLSSMGQVNAYVWKPSAL